MTSTDHAPLDTGLVQQTAAQGSAATLAGYDRVMMRTFGAPKRVFVRGEGATVWDADGRRYTDLLAGLAVNALGHAHPAVLAAITGQISTLGHVSNFFATPAQVALAERLTGLLHHGPDGTPEARVFFTNSGTEANEAAFKITRRTGRTKIVSTEGAFHGRSLGALAITHNPGYRAPFEPLPGDVVFVPYGDADALAAAVDETVAAVVLEPIQGENGIVVPPPDYLVRAREITRRAGALLWVDEVQTGIGRCGEWLAHLPTGITPDVVTVAKGLGNGFPIGACLAMGPAADLLGPGAHGSTFGGNPVAAIAGLAVLGVIERDGLLDHATAMGERLVAGVEAIGHPLVAGVRGMGLLRGIVLTEAVAPAVADLALDHGFIINAPRPSVLRLAPPLIIGPEQLDAFVAVLPGLLDRVAGGAG
ncbi:acetylornithine aminotransferase [Friedmanniella endophytica]|uniref:Acetylornithine aminotransferase n=1 Tax=Microlunatus kandeliicorticis TaxID=1759536 RepID=A0A7W3IU56_9ACTN|nr:acetylornithine transaminase [Microlunatus kandeliicorticis]MBA8795289.1 acetylornithine aminotransferase [Microlunatus kandeliicorticis]